MPSRTVSTSSKQWKGTFLANCCSTEVFWEIRKIYTFCAKVKMLNQLALNLPSLVESDYFELGNVITGKCPPR